VVAEPESRQVPAAVEELEALAQVVVAASAWVAASVLAEVLVSARAPVAASVPAHLFLPLQSRPLRHSLPALFAL